MDTITIYVDQKEVYEEVGKATDYTGSKMIESDENARDRILASDDDLAVLGRFWDEAVCGANESLKEMLVSGISKDVAVGADTEITPALPGQEMGQSRASSVLQPVATRRKYVAEISVSKSFDTALTGSVESAMRSYFIASIVGQWFKFANKGEAGEYFEQGAEFKEAARRLLYSRKRPTRPSV